MLYQIQNGSLSFGEKIVLNHIDMEIKGKEKIGIVGANGTGKTSLLKLIAGELQLDRDDKRSGKGIICSRQIRIGTMSQDNTHYLQNSVEEILLSGFYEKYSDGIDLAFDNFNSEWKEGLDYSSERFYYEQKYDKMLQSFGFAVKDKTKKLSEFSGGEQTKIMLVKLLMTEADILLFDEPTNHLDEESVEALEQYLTEYSGAAVIVSHDRYFLDRVAEVIYELEDARLKKYAGNYSAYRIEKRKQWERQQKAYERQQEEIAKNEQLIRQFKNKPRKAAFARSRKTMLERMERIEKPKGEVGHIFTSKLTPEYPGPKWMLQMEKLQIGFPKEHSLMGELDLRVKRGQKIGIIGKNGIGKTTLLKTLIGLLEPLKGDYRYGEKVTIGYFDQSTGQMNSEEKVAEYFRNAFPGMLEKDVYGILASFLFRGSICQHPINTLSGGEKARLRLCELLTVCPNFLILDEPTNHMDIPAKETLESAFQMYTGTMLIVSHDRYFLDQVADSILVLEEGAAYYYPFGYSHYIQKKKKMMDLLSKGVSLDELPGLLTTQEQAMVASLKAVPKAKAIASRQLTDDEAYLDWKLRLAKEPMDEIREEVSQLYDRYIHLQQIYNEQQMMKEDATCCIEKEIRKTELENALAELEIVISKWTDACIEWYSIYNDADYNEHNEYNAKIISDVR